MRKKNIKKWPLLRVLRRYYIIKNERQVIETDKIYIAYLEYCAAMDIKPVSKDVLSRVIRGLKSASKVKLDVLKEIVTGEKMPLDIIVAKYKAATRKEISKQALKDALATDKCFEFSMKGTTLVVRQEIATKSKPEIYMMPTQIDKGG